MRIKVIYKGVLTTVLMRLSKLLDSFKQPVLVTIFFISTFTTFQLLQAMLAKYGFYSFYMYFFTYKKMQFQTILFPYKKCVKEEENISNQSLQPLNP
jgi:hypothetical protein